MSNKKLIVYLLVYNMFASIGVYAQVEGFVRDSKDNEVLPFTHVVNQTTTKGVFTDINGFYRIEASVGDVLLFSYIGYTKQNITVKNSSQINVRLISDGYTLNELAVRPGVNPAHRIIDNVIANRHKNNPDMRNAYSCVLYNKLIAEIVVDSVENPTLYEKTRKDTASYLLINEAVVRHEYKYKGNVNEHIISSRTSGFNEYQMLALLQPTLQFFHFYNDIVEWKVPVKFFLSPISKGSTSKYFFHLRDTIVSGADSTFIISYQPRRGANFEGMKGLMHINSNGWAIQSITAEPADYTPVRLKIQQSYAIVGAGLAHALSGDLAPDHVWFPSELSLELFVTIPQSKGVYGVYRGKSHITDINLSPDLSDRTFKSRTITIADNAHLNFETIEQYRDMELTTREDSTYRLLGDLNMDYLIRYVEGLSDKSAISIKIFDFPIDKIVQQNYHEGLRIGLGMYTNRFLSPWFSVGGYYGYGIDDYRTKYGASFSLFPEKHLDSEMKLWWANDLMNLSMSHEVGFSARKLLKKFDVTTRFLLQEIHTIFDYSYMGQDMSLGWIRNAEAGLMLRYAHREERVKMFKRTQHLFTKHPVVYLNLLTGIPNFFGSTYKYLKTEAGIERNWYIRNLGTVNFSLWGGWISHDVPFPLAFTVTDTEQSLFHTNFPDSRKNFNVLTGDIYASNQYLNVFLYHDFGTLLYKTRSNVFRPRIALAQSFGWSKLNNQNDKQLHYSPDFNILDMQQGYFESGIIIEDIIRVKIFNLFFFGLGGGVYGAYGNSVQKPFEKTLTPKIRLSGTF